MTEQQAIVAAIRANPSKSTPRLAYADWLDDHDQPERGELIRVAAAKEDWKDYRGGGGLDGWREWYERAKIERVKLAARLIMLAGWQSRWAAVHPLGPYVLWDSDLYTIPPVPGLCFSLGLIVTVSCTESAWLEHGRWMLDSDPISVVHLTESEQTSESLRTLFPEVEKFHFDL